MGRPATFDVDDLAAAGLAVVAERGWAAVSVRSVAHQLGVSTMALYRVVPDAPALRRAIADVAAAAIQPTRRPGDDVFSGLERWARRAHRHLGAHPGLAGFVVGEWTELPRWLDIVESLLAAAEADGLRGKDAVATVNAVFAFVLARARLRDDLAAAGPRRLGPVHGEPDRYPRIRHDLDDYAVADPGTHFGIGLDALLAGLRREPVTSGSGPSRRPPGAPRSSR